MDENFQPDSVVQAVIDKFAARAKMGKEKYGVTMDRNDLEFWDWLSHFQEELMDGIVYAEKIKQQIKK
jgi:hypothetical protein